MSRQREQSAAGSDSGPVAFEIVAMASSAGGLAALTRVLSMLPREFPTPIAVVQHLDRRHHSFMDKILNGRTELSVKQAEHEERLRAGTVYIAPPDHHLLIDAGGSVSLTHTELVHFVRPSATLLFESVAASYKDRAIAVVLTGTGMDGSLGIQAVKKMGGIVIAQNEATSEFFGMPGAAIKTGDVDFILPLEEIAPALVKLVVTGEPR